MSERNGIFVNASAEAGTVAVLASAIVEVLAAGGEARTPEAVMLAALDVLRQASQPGQTTVQGNRIDMGDSPQNISVTRPAA